MINIHVELKGLKEAQRKMENAARRLSGDAVFGAVRDSTLLVQRDAKKNAPVRYGILRASIIPTVSAEGSRVVGTVGTNVEYAGFQEFGTRYITGRHYMGRALDDNRARIISMIQAAVKGVFG